MPLPGDQQEQKAFLLSQYLDGDLDEAGRREVEQMLAEDSQWALELERLKKVDELAKRWGAPAPELDWDRFTLQVSWRRAAEQASQPKRGLYRVLAPLPIAAAIALIATVYVAVMRPDATRPAGESVAVVQVERGDAWRSDVDLGSAYVEASVVRTPGLQIIASSSPSASGIAIAGAGVAEESRAEATPYF